MRTFSNSRDKTETKSESESESETEIDNYSASQYWLRLITSPDTTLRSRLEQC